jgi:D-alanyl-D-alanine carboxypeptidase/D-alanyl-D-alanine-endopeptidase (penicillin-binding protein 4)
MNGPSIPGGWVWDDIGNYYGAGVSALSYSDNLYDIHFSSGKTEGEKCVIKSIQPEIAGLFLENRVTSSKRTGDHTIIFGAPGSYYPYIEGTIPVNQSDFVVKGAMPDPAMAAGGAFIKELKANGIQLTGGIAMLPNGTSPVKTILGTMVSPPLKELIVPLNKESLNFFAEHLLREIGRKSSGTPSIEKGIETYQFFCTLKGVDNQGFFPVDGSGLSRSNALTSKTLVETMKRVYDGKNRDIFFGALPVAGVDGTLRHSFKGTPLEKNMRAKTGSMARVRSIAGTMKTKNKREILFALIINNFDLSTPETTKLLESILMSLYNESN